MRVELKVCERCGALWFRIAGSDEVYCAQCQPLMRRIARSTKLARPSRWAGVQ